MSGTKKEEQDLLSMKRSVCAAELEWPTGTAFALIFAAALGVVAALPPPLRAVQQTAGRLTLLFGVTVGMAAGVYVARRRLHILLSMPHS